MNKSKRKRLEASGWKLGDPSEFLGLSKEEVDFLELKLLLTKALRDLRKRQNLTQVEVAKRIGSSQSRVAKMEAGDPTVSLDLLTRSLLALGATRKDIASSIAG